MSEFPTATEALKLSRSNSQPHPKLGALIRKAASCGEYALTIYDTGDESLIINDLRENPQQITWLKTYGYTVVPVDDAASPKTDPIGYTISWC